MALPKSLSPKALKNRLDKLAEVMLMNGAWKRLLNEVEVLLRAGKYGAALSKLRQDPNLYQYVVASIINALMSYPGGKISDLSGNVYSTAELANMLRQGKWLPVHFNFLLSEIDIIQRQLG